MKPIISQLKGINELPPSEREARYENPPRPVTYKSSVLKETFSNDDCQVCKFIEGDRSHETLMEVIRLLDLYLAKEEAGGKFE